MIITVLVFAFAGSVFVGCDDDDYDDIYDHWEDTDEANLLCGTWEGHLGTYYEDRWGIGGEDFITTMRFDKPGYGTTSGRGYEVDRPLHGIGGDYYYCEFRWYIDSGIITIVYDDDIYYPVYIYDYRLTTKRFSGFMDDGTNQEIKFNFRYVGDFDWGIYYNGAKGGLKGNIQKKDSLSK